MTRRRPESRILRVNDLNLHVLDWGGDGHPVLLLHGLASNAHIWDAVAPLLVGGGRVVAVDQRGHGMSDKSATDYGFRAVGSDVVGLMDVLGWERALVVGHSWGGNVALHAGVEHPGRTAAVVLVDGGFLDLRGEGMSWEKVEVELAPPDLTSLTMDELMQQARSWSAESGWSEATEATIRGTFRVAEDGRIRPQLARENHMQILRAMWEQRPGDLYSRVEAPALLIPAYRETRGQWREYQERKRAEVAKALQLMPRARLLEMNDTIHDVPLQRPRELAGAIESMLADAGGDR